MNTLTSAPWGSDVDISIDVAVITGTLEYPPPTKVPPENVYATDDASLNDIFATSIFALESDKSFHLGVRLTYGYTFTYLFKFLLVNVVDPMTLSSKR
jgi:hypothetical protein